MAFIRTAATVLAVSSAELAAGVGLGLGSLAAGLGVGGVVTYVLVNMPEDHLNEPATEPDPADKAGWTRLAAKYGRNLFGGAMIATGLVLAVPSIPPGKSMALLGLMALDFRGKRRLERRILGRPKVLSRVNRVRARFGRPPLRIDGAARAEPQAPSPEALPHGCPGNVVPPGATR